MQPTAMVHHNIPQLSFSLSKIMPSLDFSLPSPITCSHYHHPRRRPRSHCTLRCGRAPLQTAQTAPPFSIWLLIIWLLGILSFKTSLLCCLILKPLRTQSRTASTRSQLQNRFTRIWHDHRSGVLLFTLALMVMQSSITSVFQQSRGEGGAWWRRRRRSAMVAAVASW